MGKLISQIGENLTFVLECLGIFAGLFLLALLFERCVMKQRKKLGSTHFLSYTAIFSAMAGVLSLCTRFRAVAAVWQTFIPCNICAQARELSSLFTTLR